MGTVDIRVEGISKRYRIGSSRRRHDSLKELLGEALRGRGLVRRGAGSEADVLWSLRDISFSVEKGEVLGIVGGNGAGKSTLLKILSRITRPTEGRVDLFGRVSSLLEVGTGFHPELTGRENVYLNGSILGMRRAEIRRKFGEIIAFAGVERFLDTPVKRYSSGMYVRLAFAVAANLDPEILIVDEVLAVGDVEFQDRCLGKIGEVARGGRTVLFVSHNLGVVQTLCTRGIFLEDGRVRYDGSTSGAVSTYLDSLKRAASGDIARRTDRQGSGRTRIIGVRVGQGDSSRSALALGSPARFTFQVEKFVAGLTCSFTIYDRQGLAVASFDSAVRGSADEVDPSIGLAIICEIEELPLIPGPYRIHAGLYTGPELLDHVEAAIDFQVEQGYMHGRPEAAGYGYGNVCVPHRWKSPR